MERMHKEIARKNGQGPAEHETAGSRPPASPDTTGIGTGIGESEGKTDPGIVEADDKSPLINSTFKFLDLKGAVGPDAPLPYLFRTVQFTDPRIEQREGPSLRYADITVEDCIMKCT